MEAERLIRAECEAGLVAKTGCGAKFQESTCLSHRRKGDPRVL